MQTQPVSLHENTLILLREEHEKLVENTEQQQKIAYLEHELAQLKRMIFGSRRERFVPVDSGQLALGLESVATLEATPQQEQAIRGRKRKAKLSDWNYPRIYPDKQKR